MISEREFDEEMAARWREHLKKTGARSQKPGAGPDCGSEVAGGGAAGGEEKADPSSGCGLARDDISDLRGKAVCLFCGEASPIPAAQMEGGLTTGFRICDGCAGSMEEGFREWIWPTYLRLGRIFRLHYTQVLAELEQSHRAMLDSVTAQRDEMVKGLYNERQRDRINKTGLVLKIANQAGALAEMKGRLGRARRWTKRLAWALGIALGALAAVLVV